MPSIPSSIETTESQPLTDYEINERVNHLPGGKIRKMKFMLSVIIKCLISGNPKYLERYEDVVFDLEQALVTNLANGAHQKKNGYRFVVDNSGEVTPFD